MIRHLKASDFKVMPWANGRGQTVEMWREERDGTLLWRLSRAVVAEDGAFSLFPGLDRSLTVIDGPGFDLVGAERLTARYLQPVAFAGDVDIRAEGVVAPCEDFNVMVRRGTVAANVQVLASGRVTGAVFALEPVRVGKLRMARYDLVLCDEEVAFVGLSVVVRGLWA
ncbi:MAG: HutD family protein [Candidatus Saccharibacteria bacterium]|nr:HutD family protein [Pseudorhodobacter sp.]